MKLRHTDTPLPSDWSKIPNVRGLLLDHNLRMARCRLQAKLLVFDSPQNLRHFWKNCLDKSDLGKHCKGAVNSLIQEVHIIPGKKDKFKESAHLEADPRYFCVIGLVKGWLTMEVICHEAVHAAFSYAKRVNRTPWDKEAKHFDEEAICYPSGRIASAINRILWKKGLLPQ